MKKPYNKPEIKTTLFAQQDIICASGPFKAFNIIGKGGSGNGIKWSDVRDF